MNLRSDAYVDMKTAASKLGITGKDPGENARTFLKRHGVPLDWRGYKRVVLITSLEELMKRQRQAKRRAA